MRHSRLTAAGESHHAPTIAREAFDVSGAGDTVIATMALATACGVTTVVASSENTSVLVFSLPLPRPTRRDLRCAHPPINLIVALRPDVLVNGGDYLAESVVGAHEVRSWGGRIAIVPTVEGFSTTNIVRKVAHSTDY
jgi:bifunctional ADP-heptose synthase (sugar kinase/adenylyltransferase)